MRKLLLMVTMLLVPALANAWTMPVSVTNTSAGIAAGNKATVTIGSTSTDVTAGTKYFYPASTVATATVTLGNPGSVLSVTVNGAVPADYTGPGDATFTVAQGATMQSVKVVYTTAATAAKYNVSVIQPTGGLVSLAIGSSSTTIGYTGVTTGTAVTVKANPNAGYALSSIKVNGSDVAAASPYTLTVTTNDEVTAVFTPVLSLASFELAAPASATSGVASSAVANVVTNASAVYYKFTSTCSDSQSAFGTDKTFNFTPNAAGTCTVTAYVSLSADGSNAQSKSAAIPVVDGTTASNYTCTSCHSGSTPAIVASYNRSVHVSEGQTCEACHTSQAHTAGVNATNVSTTTFKALTAAGPAAQGDYFCWNATCHANRLATDLPRIQASSHFAQYNGSACSSCHGTDMHDQNGEFINKCGKCHAETGIAEASKHYTAVTDASCRTCHTGTVGYGYNATPTISGSSMTFTRPSSASVSKHRPEMFAYATSNACATCHADIRTEFRQTAHWNNHLEYGPEFSGGAVEGQMNANESWTTTEDGTKTTCSTRCHFKPNLGPNPKAVDTNNYGLRPGKDECVACHDPHKLTANYQGTCMTCHNGSKHGKVPSEFWNSKHWNNHYEYGDEFANQINTSLDQTTSRFGGTVTNLGTTSNGYLNANDAYKTTENGSVVTCAYRCHFRPGMYPADVTPPAAYVANGHAKTYVSYTDTLNGKTYTRPGGDACMACHDAHGLEATYQSTCLTCHTGGNHGKVPNKFFGSKHWKNSFEYGEEFAGQLEATVQNGNVKLGSPVNGVLDANDSYQTTEFGEVVSCAYRCHFRPGMGPEKDVAGYLAGGKATSYITYSSPYGAGKFSRPGGDSCMACHDAHGLEATARSTCYTCHTGKATSHGWAVATFEASTHFTSPYAVAEGLGGPTGKACTACHDAHSTEIAFGKYSSLTPVAASGCQTCHTKGAPYGIYNADQSGKAPHYNANAGAYVTARTTCGDCHNHKTSINKGWAESGHGSITAQPFNGGTADDWKSMGSTTSYQTDPTVRNCNRCHTAKGFAQFVDSRFANVTPLQAANPADLTSEPLVCSACHTHLGKGTLRTANFTSEDGLTKGYPALLGYKDAAITNNIVLKSTLQFSDMKNSNICIPCHSQRGTGKLIKELYANPAFLAYSSGSKIYGHAAQAAGIVDGKGGYDFNTPSATFEHNNFGSTDKQGACAGCHLTSANTHSLEVVNFGNMSTVNGKTRRIVSSKCTSCHDTSLTVDLIEAKKAQFNAAVKVLGNLLADQGLKPGERVNFDWSKGTKNRAVAERNQGAWFNWFLFTEFDASVDGEGSDRAAYIHNPSYTKRLVRDSIDWLDNGVLDNSAAAAVAAQSTAGKISSVEAADATLFVTSSILP